MIRLVAIVISLVLSGALPPLPNAVESDANGRFRLETSKDLPEDQFKVILARLHQLQDSGTLGEMIAEIDNVERQWGEGGGERYAIVYKEFLGGCLSMSRIRDENNGVDEIRARYVMFALKHPDSFSLNLEWQLLGQVDGFYLKKSLDERDVEYRKNATAIWFHAVHRLETEKDPNFDKNDLPTLNVSPPLGDEHGMLIPGVSPNAIKDPVKRAAYEKVIEENQKKAIYFNLQYELRRDEALIMKDVVRYVSGVYSKPPLNRDELAEMLTKYKISAEIRKNIEGALSTK